MAFGKKPSSGFHMVFGQDGARPFTSAGNTSFDLSSGTMYTHAGNTVFGSDGSVHQVFGNGSTSTVLGSDGSTHLVQHNGDSSFII